MKSRNRYIPKDVDLEVKKRHYFECAWCGVNLTERHHISEFSNGGQHTSDNLILLCPNCHTQAHNGEINLEDLIARKSNHTKGDRLSGGVQFSLQQPYIRLGNAQFKNVPILIQYKTEPLITLKEVNGEFLLSARFYNKSGNLVFWMSSNRYWTNSDFLIESKKYELIITNNELTNNKLRIWQDQEALNIEGVNYLNGKILNFNPNYVQFGTSIMYGMSAIHCTVGIFIP